MAAAVDVFDHDEADETRIGIVIVEGEFDQLADRIFGRQSVEPEAGLCGTNFRISLVEDLDEEILFGLEIVEDQPLRDLGARGDRIRIAAGEAVLRKFDARDIENLLAGPYGVALP